MLRLMRKAQSTAEYAIVIGLVIGAAVAMQIYVKRGLQAKVKDAVDFNDATAGSYGIGATTQYEPDYMTTTDMRSTRKAEVQAKTSTGGGLERNIIGEEESSRTGTQNIAGVTAAATP